MVDYDMGYLSEGLLKATISFSADPAENAGLAVVGTDNVLLGYGRSNELGNVEVPLIRPVSPGDSVYCYVSGENILLSDTMIVAVETPLDKTISHLLLEAYPNPFNPATTLHYRLPEEAEIQIGLYDLRGKKIKTLFHDTQTAGDHRIAVHGDELSSGVYFCRLESGPLSKTIKLLLLK
jgi:hypothetical protein